VDELSQILRDATLCIEHCYFELPIDGGPSVLRERVYCYELYHQMRVLWPATSEFKLNGEIDKQAHPILTQLGAAGAKPDFLIHAPGHMAGNHAIIEVKHSTAARGMRKDLKTLDLFVSKVGYRRAIYLIYGSENPERVIEKFLRAAKPLNVSAPIELWVHSSSNEPAVHVASLLPSM
jgi:hypothetical protein